MKTSDSSLRALLHGSTTAAFTNLVTLVTKAGTTVRWTAAAYDVVYGGNTFIGGATGTAPGVQPMRIREAVGLEVSTLELNLDCGTSAQIGGVALQLAALNGVLDDARVTVQRVYMATPGGAVVGTSINRFSGVVSDCQVDSVSVRLRVQSDLYKLDEQLPRHLIREKCSWALGDAGCGVNLASFTGTYTAQNGVLGAPPGQKQFACNYVSGYSNVDAEGGILTFTSGVLAGLSRSILGKFTVSTTDYVEVVSPFPSAPAAGDSFTWMEPCNKTTAKCDGVFANLDRRRGFDFVPSPEQVTR